MNNKPELTDEQRWCPDVDPITRYPLFMWISHPELGYVPTYGGPYDSYTLTERDSNGEFFRHRYDHDFGGWVEDEYIGVIVVEDWLPKDQAELDEYVKDNLPAELQERRKADNAEPVFFIEVEGDDWIQAGRIPGSTFDFNNLPDGINKLYAAPQPVPDSEAQTMLKRLAVILHGSEVDLNRLTVTAQSLVDRCRAYGMMIAVCEICGRACNNPNHPQKAVRASEAYKL